MPQKTTIKKAPAAKKKVVVVHTCTQKGAIKHLVDNTNKLSIIITGNGEPEKGLCSQVALINERQKGVLQAVNEVNEQLKGVNENHNVLLGEITRVGAKVDNSEKQEERDQIAKDLIEKKKQDAWQRWVWIFMGVLTLAGLLLNIIHSSKNGRKLDNLGTPVIINSRGMPTVLPNGDQLRMYPKDFTGDTTKVKKTNVKK